MKPKLLILAALLIPAITQAEVPEHVAQRAKEIVRHASGTAATVVSVSREQEIAGLTQATRVVYSDGLGNRRYLTMLPDGEHFITGQLLSAGKVLGQAPAMQVAPDRAVPTLATTAKSDSHSISAAPILTPNSFKTDTLKANFDSPEDAPEAFFSVLSQAPSVIDGENNENIYYVMYDPACQYCLKKYEMLRSHIDAGKLTAHWIPVAAVSRPPFTALFALSDPGADNDEKLERLRSLVSGTPRQIAIEDREAAGENLMQTTSLLSLLKNNRNPSLAAGTPQSFYRGRDGQIRHHYGYHPSHLEELLGDMQIN